MLMFRLSRRVGGRSCVSQERMGAVRGVGFGCDTALVVVMVLVMLGVLM